MFKSDEKVPFRPLSSITHARPPLLCAVVPHVFSLLSFVRSHSSQRCQSCSGAQTPPPPRPCPASCGLRSRTAPVLHPQPSVLDPPEGIGAEAAVGARGVEQRRRGMESSAGGDGARGQRRRGLATGSANFGGGGAARTVASEGPRRPSADGSCRNIATMAASAARHSEGARAATAAGW